MRIASLVARRLKLNANLQINGKVVRLAIIFPNEFSMSSTNLPAPNPHPAYRPDIDGLRAIAISLVVMFHATPSQPSGGFVGVDIFFIISGFLISTIIYKGLEQGGFSYTDFYVRRIKRIFPALILVLSACLIFGWFILLQDEYKSLGKHVAGGGGFISNLILWGESGYFDTTAAHKPLLHLWSLGIEEQFYIAWPLLLVMLSKRTSHIFLAVSLLALISFLSNLWLINGSPIAAFYFPLTRFWELLLGSMLAYVTLFHGGLIALLLTRTQTRGNDLAGIQNKLSEVSAFLGMALIIGACTLIDKDRAFPGWWALLPTLGAILLISAGPQAWFNRKVLSHRILVYIGLISYPLYLWHWPILSFANIVSYGMPQPWIRLCAVAASILLAWLTYKLIEKPTQGKRGLIVPITLSGLILLISIAGYFIYQNDGLPHRAINKGGDFKTYMESRRVSAEIKARYQSGNCADLGQRSALTYSMCRQYGSSTQDAIVIWGDSHADAWAPVFLDIAKDNHLRVIIFSQTGCPPLVGIRRTDIGSVDQNCNLLDTEEDIVKAIQTIKPRHIFMISRWSLYTNGWFLEGSLQSATHYITTDPIEPADIDSSRRAFETQLFATLQILTKDFPVTVFRSMPNLKTHIQKGIIRKMAYEPTLAEHRAYEATPDKAIDQSLYKLGNLDVFDPASLLCEQACKAIINRNVYYSDDNHVSAQGALQFKERLLNQHFGFLTPTASPHLAP